MRRFVTLLPALGLVVALLIAAASSPRTGAQEAENAMPVAPGVVIEPVADDVTPPLVAEQAGLELVMARFEPGASYTVPASNTSLLLVAVESGTLTVTSTTPLVVNRAATVTTARAQAHELIPAGTEIALAAGDSFVRPPESEQEFRNEGAEPAAAFAASLAQDAGGALRSQAVTPEAGRGGAGLVVAVAVVVVPECPAGYDPADANPMATPGGGGGGGGEGGVAVAIAAAPECVGPGAGSSVAAATPAP